MWCVPSARSAPFRPAPDSAIDQGVSPHEKGSPVWGRAERRIGGAARGPAGPASAPPPPPALPAAQAATPAARIVAPHAATVHVATTGAFTVPHTRVVCSRGRPRCVVEAMLRPRLARKAVRVAPGKASALRLTLSAGQLAAV